MDTQTEATWTLTSRQIKLDDPAAAVICTGQFISSARMTAQTFGMDGYPIAVVLHPIGRVTEGCMNSL